MESLQTRLYESTAFEVTHYQNLTSYSIYADEESPEHAREAVLKQPEVLLCDTTSHPFTVLTSQPVSSRAIAAIVDGQPRQLQLEDRPMTFKSKLELLFSHTIEFSESIVRVSEKLYFIASETFFAFVRKNEKLKIYPFFSFEILELEKKALIIIHLMLYSQNYPSLMKALEEDYLQKSSSLDQLIVPLFKYKVNFLLFDSEYENKPTVDLRSLEFYENKENVERLVRLKHLDTEEFVVMSAANFNVLNKMDESTLQPERVYLLYRLRLIIGGLALVARCGIDLSVKTHKPDLVAGNVDIVRQMDLQSVEDDKQLANWTFICSEEDAVIGTRLAKDLSITMKHVFRLDNFKPQRAFTVPLNPGVEVEQTMLEGLQKSLSDETYLVVILINKIKPSTTDIEHLLLSKNKKYLIFEAPELVTQRNYMQTKIDELYMDFGSTFRGKVLGLHSPIVATFVKVLQTPQGAYTYSTSLSIAAESVDIKKTISRPAEFLSLGRLLDSLSCTSSAQLFFLSVCPSQVRADDVSDKNIVYVSKSSLSIFPNLSLSDYYLNMKLDMQSSRTLISYAKNPQNAELATSFEQCFIYGRIDRNNMAILDRSKSYCLNFVKSLSELDLPVVESIFAVVRNLKQDFAYYL